ncbi:amidohydrolase family protein [uncultured Tenacibaculum sp.]|uniref:amidohydrolase family protein n=1 Tax=uncultured Tenacibaculum sp. TaxID=174713 RepID=UPI0026149E77|nr:amidohydrolase family protein [uncultured Tenacibaculum sp.]
MKKTILLILIVFGINHAFLGQIPKEREKQIIALVKESDKLIKEKPVEVKENINRFLSYVPSPELVKIVLNLMQENSSTKELKILLNDFSKGKITIEEAVEEVESKIYALTNVNLIDGTSSKPKVNSTIVFKGTQITDIYKGNAKKLNKEAIVIDLKGKYIMPGLIDSHVHYATDPSLETYESVKKGFRKVLGSGILGIRDMGGDGRALAYYKRQLLANQILGPDLNFSSILAGPNFFSDSRVIASSVGVELGTGAWAHKVTKETDLTSLMQRVKGIGSTAVKLYYDIDGNLAKKIADAAKKAGLKVWAHWAIRPSDAKQTSEAGVQVVSHAQIFGRLPEGETNESALKKYGEKELWEIMKKKGTILEPTFAVYNDRKEKSINDMANLLTKNALKAGIRIAAGSDVHGNDELPGGHIEYRLLKERAGMTIFEVLKSATLINSEATGFENQLGKIAIGKPASFLVYEQNPLKDITFWAKPLYVVKKGTIYSGAELRDENSTVTPLYTLNKR